MEERVGLLHRHSHFGSLQPYQSPLSCAGVYVSLSGACSVINKTVLHFPFKYGSYCICSVGQNSSEGRKDKWKDLGTQILCPSNSHD